MEDWKKRLGSYDSLDEAIFVTIDEETIYTIDKLVDFIEQEIDKAREEGREEGINAVLYPKFRREKDGTLKREGWVDTSKLKNNK